MQLVLLHALPLDASMWAEQMQILPGATIAPDLYGLGDSMEQWARGVLDQTDGGPLIVVGCSIGGSCAVEVAALAPDRVKALVLVGAKAGHRPDPSLRDAAIELLLEAGMAVAWPRHWAPLFGGSTEAMIVEAARAIAFEQKTDDVIRGIRVFHSRRDRDDFAARWPGRLVVISGEHDTAPPVATASRLAATAPAGEFHLIRDCGHYVSLERREAFDRVLELVVNDVLSGAARADHE